MSMAPAAARGSPTTAPAAVEIPIAFRMSKALWWGMFVSWVSVLENSVARRLAPVIAPVSTPCSAVPMTIAPAFPLNPTFMAALTRAFPTVASPSATPGISPIFKRFKPVIRAPMPMDIPRATLGLTVSSTKTPPANFFPFQSIMASN